MSNGDRETMRVPRSDAAGDKAWKLGVPARRELPLTLLSPGMDATEYPAHAIDIAGNVMTTTGEGLKGMVTLYIWYDEQEGLLSFHERTERDASVTQDRQGSVLISQGANAGQTESMLKAFESAVRTNLFNLNSMRLCRLSTLSVVLAQASEYPTLISAKYI
jgi:hypothetical protein